MLADLRDKDLEILDGKHDSKGEQAFYMIGTIDEIK